MKCDCGHGITKKDWIAQSKNFKLYECPKCKRLVLK